MRNQIFAFAVLALTLASATAAAAQSSGLPAATSSVSCITTSDYVIDASSCNSGTAQAQVTLAPFAAVSANSEFPGDLARVSAGATSRLDYTFEVTGGKAGDLVPLDIVTVLNAIEQGGGYAFARIIVTTGQGSVSENICTDGCGGGTDVTSFFGTLNIDARSGEQDTVDLYAETIGNFSQAANTGYASVDPMISIDQGFASAGDYSILLSDGVANSVESPAGVPEPAAWALMLAGFAGVGGLLRRRSLAATAS
jgi:hypothetical protein